MDDINYSADLLEREFADREPIRLALRSAIEQFSIRRRQVAEFGSGLGYNLEVFKGENEVTGVEGLRVAAEAASARGVKTLTADLAVPIPLDSRAYDLVLCLDVLEHLVDPEQCLNEAYRILHPQGLLLVNVPNHFSLSGRLNIMLGSGIDSVRFFPGYPDWKNPHVRFFRHSSISTLIRRCGFHLEADWSERFPSIPIISKFRTLRGSGFARALARATPELFAGGFFLIARKPR